MALLAVLVALLALARALHTRTDVARVAWLGLTWLAVLVISWGF